MISEVKIAICQKCAIAWMIVLAMKLQKFVILQIRDELGITSRIKLVLTFLEHVFVYVLNKGLLRTAHGTLHLVIDYTFNLEW